ncbi:ankyrin repeat-containing protein At5g02620-like [Cornus florida]|uniref:ankyrin repeat-containing protein At5g02620-like n=1 Tax=Cornus florida TaxID=4283 RepID=UPI002899BB20|nr:ankyrin repeat-containing protein At5g02620-like [Cornus florida]
MAQALLKAIETEDITDLKTLIENYLSEEDSAKFWENNPLLMVSQYGSVLCAKEIIRLKPELAWQRTGDGSSTVMHFICRTADVAIVKAVVEAGDPIQMICNLTDIHSRTPFHTAAINGREEVLRALVTLCPESIQKLTSQRESALHLALKNNHCGSFLVMVEELQKHDLMNLLTRQDDEGNSVLHIATLRKQIQILKMLLPDKSTNAGPVVQVNSRNRGGFTALDLHYQNFSDRNDKDISDILHQAGAKEGHLLFCSCEEKPPSSQSLTPRFTRSTCKSMKLGAVAVFITIAGAAFSSLTNLNNIYLLPLDKNFSGISMTSAKDLIMSPILLPGNFAFMVFNTAAFMASLFVAVVIICSFQWSFCIKVVSLFAILAFTVSYVFLAKEVMPKFWVVFGSYKISSFWFLWFYETLLACTTGTVCLMGKLIQYIFSKLLKRPRMGGNRPETNSRISV